MTGTGQKLVFRQAAERLGQFFARGWNLIPFPGVGGSNDKTGVRYQVQHLPIAQAVGVEARAGEKVAFPERFRKAQNVKRLAEMVFQVDIMRSPPGLFENTAQLAHRVQKFPLTDMLKDGMGPDEIDRLRGNSAQAFQAARHIFSAASRHDLLETPG